MSVAVENPTICRRSLPVRATVDEVLLWTMVVLSPLQDTALQSTPLKLVAASPAVFPLIALMALHMVRRILRMDYKFHRWTLIAAGYALLVSVAHLIAYSQGVLVLEWRALRGGSIFAILAFFVVFGLDLRNTRGLRIAAYTALCLTLVGIAIGAILGANAVPLLQSTPSLTGRPNGFSTESSTLSVQTVCTGTLTVHFLSKIWQKVGIGLLTCVLLVYSQSKGGLISLMLCITILAIIKTRSSLTIKIIAAFIVIPALYLGSLFLVSMFGSIIAENQTSSIATRLSMAIFSMITVAHNPLGIGFTGLLPAIREYLPRSMDLVQSWFPIPLAFVEVKSYLVPPYRDADCKTFFFNYFVFFGFPFAFVFFRFAFGLLRRLYLAGRDSLFVGALFCLTALLFYYSTMNAYTLPLLFGVALCEVRQRETALRMH
jgi:O-antigen ligase/polysaccharide polymerase Wzy-like membrane protein